MNKEFKDNLGFKLDGKEFMIFISPPGVQDLNVRAYMIELESEELVAEIIIPMNEVISCQADVLVKHKQKLIDQYNKNKK